MMLNTKTQPSIRKMSHVLGAIQQTARLRILLAIGEGEACVCHLETLLGYRQAYISQHLMALRKARWLTHPPGGTVHLLPASRPAIAGTHPDGRARRWSIPNGTYGVNRNKSAAPMLLSELHLANQYPGYSRRRDVSIGEKASSPSKSLAPAALTGRKSNK